MSDFDFSKITIKYEHSFGKSIVDPNDPFQAKVIGNTIYFASSKEFITEQDDNGVYIHHKFIRHQLQYVYNFHIDGIALFYIKYVSSWIREWATHWFNPFEAFRLMRYEQNAHNIEYQPLSEFEKEVLTRE